MRKVFNSNYRITQKFNERPEYYKQFKLKGHEGIDLVPTDKDWTVISLADGVIVKDEDNEKSGAYGKYVTVWHPTLRKATQYCHLSENSVSLGQTVALGQKLGTMGKTGNTQGAHLHLNLFETDVNGIRLNRDNGYFGGVDPLPFLEETALVTPIAQDNTAELDEAKATIKAFTEFRKTLSQKLATDDQTTSIIGAVERFLVLEDQVRSLQSKYDEAVIAKETAEKEVEVLEIANEELKTQLRALQGVKEDLIKADEELDLLRERKVADRFTTGELISELVKRIIRKK